MLKFWILALVGLVSLAAGATKSGASAEKDVPAAIKNEAVKAPVTFTSCSMRILAKARLIQTKISGKHKADQELTELLAWKKRLSELRLRSAVTFAQETAALQNSKNAENNQKRIEYSRQNLITRCNELERLLNQVEQNRNSPLLLEKINDLVGFLAPPELPAPQGAVETSRGAASVKDAASKQAEIGEQKK